MLVLLADDLTGACDVGVQCLHAGWPVRCCFADRPGWTVRLKDRTRSALVLDLETRRMGAAAAVRKAFETGRELLRRDTIPRYFKVDSTLRGNFVAEAEALRRASRRRLTWLVPANPSQGRWTVGGRQYVHGQPVERTAFGRDPLHPVVTGDLMAIAAATLGRRACVHLNVHELGRGPAHVRRLRRHWLRSGVRLVVADALREVHLQAIAACITREDLPCGAAALARYLLPRAVHGFRREPGGMGPLRRFGGSEVKQGKWLAVMGSVNPLTQEQVRLVSGQPGVKVRWLRPRQLSGRPAQRPPRGARWIVLALSAHGKTELPSAAAHLRSSAFVRKPSLGGRPLRGFESFSNAPLIHARFRRKQVRAQARAERLARGIARHAAAIVADWKPMGLVLSGGLTAAVVCEELGIRELALARELSPGIVASTAEGPHGRMWVVTKPGGFGAPGDLRKFVADQGSST